MIYNISIPDDETLKYERFTYPAGETQIRLLPSEIAKVVEANEIRVTARGVQNDIAPLACLTDCLQDLNMCQMSLILPYLPYSRADRRFVDGDCLGLKVFATLVNALQYDQVFTLDVHSIQARKYINNFINIEPTSLVESILSRKKENYIVLLPDEGALERYKDLPCKVLHCTKKRDPKTGKLSGFEVPDKKNFKDTDRILIVDDICDGGGTFIGIADALADNEVMVSSMELYVTHGIFSKGMSYLSTKFDKIYTSESFGKQNYMYTGVVYLPTNDLINDFVSRLVTTIK